MVYLVGKVIVNKKISIFSIESDPFGFLTLLVFYFHFINTVIPECYPVKLGTSFIGNLFIFARFLLEACRNDDNSL